MLLPVLAAAPAGAAPGGFAVVGIPVPDTSIDDIYTGTVR